jgi:peroxiredoxin
MKFKLLAAFASVSLLLSSHHSAFAAETNDLTTDLRDLVAQVRTKLREGKDTEKDLAAELKRFDELRAKHKTVKTDEVAQVAVMQSMLYLQVGNADKAKEIIEQVKTDFPETESGRNADKILASIEQQAAIKKAQAALAVGTKFPDFNEKDTAGKPLSIANYKGKVVLIDFWATWCAPCVAELPSVSKAYEKYHSKGFEIIGVSLDQDEAKLTSFIKQKSMTWPQYFDGDRKLAEKYGVESIPATFLLDGEGKILAKDLRGEALESAVAKALAGK